MVREELTNLMSSRDVLDARNYMVDVTDSYGSDFEVNLKSIVNSVQHFFVGSEFEPYCCLVERNKVTPTYVDFSINPLVNDKKLHNVDYNKAYAMMQIRARDKNRLVRILLNKKDHSVSMISFFDNCVYNEDEDFALKSANLVEVLPLVKNLIHSISAGVYMQNFLANGSIGMEGLTPDAVKYCIQ